MGSPTKYKLLPILGALSIFLSLLEYVIPKPIPFIKLGVANIPLLISLSLLPKRDLIKLIIIKSIGGSLISGTLFSWIFLYSLSGSLVSGMVMIGVFKLLGKRVTYVGISILGALTSNITQITIATLFLGSGAKYLGIPILITGFVTGLLTGLFSNSFVNNSKWVRSLTLEK